MTARLIDGKFRRELEATNLGFAREVEMIRTAHEMGFFTIVYVFNPEESAMMARAGADVIIGFGEIDGDQTLLLEQILVEAHREGAHLLEDEGVHEVLHLALVVGLVQ